MMITEEYKVSYCDYNLSYRLRSFPYVTIYDKNNKMLIKKIQHVNAVDETIGITDANGDINYIKPEEIHGLILGYTEQQAVIEIGKMRRDIVDYEEAMIDHTGSEHVKISITESLRKPIANVHFTEKTTGDTVSAA